MRRHKSRCGYSGRVVNGDDALARCNKNIDFVMSGKRSTARRLVDTECLDAGPAEKQT